MAYKDEVLVDEPVAYWKLDEESGTTAADEIGSNDGTYNGSPTLGQSPLIQSATSVGFDGTDDYVLVPADSSLGTITIQTAVLAAWISFTTSDTTKTFLSLRPSIGTSSTEETLVVLAGRPNTGQITVRSGGLDVVQTTATYNDGASHFVVAIKDGSQISLYVDGVFIGSAAGGSLSGTDPLHLAMGANYAESANLAQAFPGQIDEVALYHHVLSPRDIRRHYYAGLGYTGYALQTLADDPLLYWRLDELSGTAATDETGSYPGTYKGGVTLAQDPAVPDGTSVTLDGTDDLVIADPSPSSMSAWSASVWLYPTESGGNNTVVADNGRDVWDIFFNNVEELHFHLFGGAGTNIGSQALSLNAWHHAVFVYDGSDVNAYVNGAFVGSNNDPGISWPGDFIVGAYSDPLDEQTPNMFQGSIDEVVVFDRALTATEVRRSYYAGLGYKGYALEVMALGPVAYWRLDEASGTTTTDETGNHDGTYNGLPTFDQPPLIQSGTSVDFDGTDDYISQPYVLPSKGSIGFWMKPVNAAGTVSEHFVSVYDSTGADNQQFVMQSFTDGNTYWGWQVDSTDYRIVLSDAYPTAAIYVVFTWDSSTGESKLYWNGVLKGSTAGLPTPKITASPHIGAERNVAAAEDNFYAGGVDEVAIYDYVLTASEIEHLYAYGLYAAFALFRVAGTVQLDGSAGAATVRALEFGTNALVGEKTSGAGDGAYEFRDLDTDNDLLIVAEADGYRPLAHGPVTPEEQ